MPWACAMAVRKDGTTSPAVTVVTPLRMKSRLVRAMVVSPLHELVFGGADEQARQAGGPCIELLAFAVPRAGRRQVRHQRLLRRMVHRRRRHAIEHFREQRLRRSGVGGHRGGEELLL